MKSIFCFIILLINFSSFSQNYTSKSVRPFETNADDWFKIESINLYGGGSLLGLVTADSSIEDATSPTGSVGINFSTKRISCNLFFSYNGRKSTDVKDLSKLGNALMNPNLGGQSFTFSALGRINKFIGFSTSFQIADNIWQISNTEEIDASPLIGRIGFYVRPFDFGTNKEGNNDINLTLNIHYSHRSILGDFNNNTQTIDSQEIKPRGYNGIDFSINTYLNSVHLFVQFSSNKTKKFDIPGFTGSQVTFGINVTGNLIKVK